MHLFSLGDFETLDFLFIKGGETFLWGKKIMWPLKLIKTICIYFGITVIFKMQTPLLVFPHYAKFTLRMFSKNRRDFVSRLSTNSRNEKSQSFFCLLTKGVC